MIKKIIIVRATDKKGRLEKINDSNNNFETIDAIYLIQKINEVIDYVNKIKQ